MNRYFTAGCSLLAALLLSACLSTEDAGTFITAASGGDSGDDSPAATTSEPTSKKEARLSAAADVFKAATVSDDKLKSATRQMMTNMDKQAKIAPPANKYAKRLVKLTSKHTKEDGLALNFKVYLEDNVNAFATPDGSIRVFSGLMDLMTDDELRSVIGHEIAHVKLGHSLKEARVAYLASAAAKVASSETNLNNQALLELAEKFINAQYSQSQESESDAYGVEFMKRHKFKIQASESAMRKLANLDGTAAGKTGSLFSSHPGSKQRADKIHELISQ